ncbi:MAG: heparinase II/III-family protein [Opitutaceae bacterium]|nr:heparinase II/III-family protein [Opitutaceae bacterium]
MGLTAWVSVFLGATWSKATDLVVVTDTMSRASRTAAPTSAGAQWFIIGPGTTVSYAPNALTVSNGGSAQFLGYFTPSASPVSLKVGQNVTLTFTFSFTGSLGTTTDATAFRIGLFNSGGSRISGDITSLSSSLSFEAYGGYAAMMSPTTSGQSLRKRVPLAATNKNNLIGTTSGVYGAPLVSGPSQTLVAGVNYTAIVKAERTSAGVQFSISLSGGSLSNYTLSHVDTTDGVTVFDTLAVGWSSGLVATGGGVRVNNLTVTATPTVNPPGTNDADRPFIWVRQSERAAILNKISTQSWALSAYNTLVSRASADITSHQNNRDAELRELPVTWTTTPARFKTIPTYSSSEVRTPAVAKFDSALNCAVLYYLTNDAKYARYAADVLHNTIKTLVPVAPSTELGNGGWIIQNDFLLEARALGTQLPIIYDFVRPFLATNQVYDVQTAGMVNFNFTQAQTVFRTYYELARDHGQQESNWSALMSTSMMNNLLALNDATERAAALQVFLLNGTSRQRSLDEDYIRYPVPDSVWPESLQYAVEVVTVRSTQLVLLDRYDSTLNLLRTYPNFPASLERTSFMRFPNGQQISFGDGPRNSPGEPYFEYELIYRQAKDAGFSDLVSHFGARIARGVRDGRHNRASLPTYSALGLHNEPLQLLLFSPTIAETAVDQVLPRTDTLPFAGVVLQRNPAPVDNTRNGLMAFVGGAGFIHSHASGMSMELYGLGQVLGAKSGRTTYGSAENENYYRVFASNNTVVVNGASRGQGGWNDIAINTVQVAAMEPAVGAAGVSPNHSFTVSTFSDDKGTGAEATQQRTVAIVRTSPTTGYYVDIFRSDSSLANEFHDYIYRNVGDTVTLRSGTALLPLTSAPTRFQTDIGDSRDQPGWRYFTETEVSAATSANITARFVATRASGDWNMTMFMAGASNREYARVKSPAIVDAPSPFDDRLAPAVVIRRIGSAWNEPFAAVFEPHGGTGETNTVRAVSKLITASVVVGLKVESVVAGRNVVQYVFSPPTADGTYDDPSIGLSFRGRFAVASDHGDGTGSLYLGDGASLAFKGYTLRSATTANTQAHLAFGGNSAPVLTGSAVVDAPPALTPLERWRQARFGSSANSGAGADTADPDADGQVNLNEYLLGTDPLSPGYAAPLSMRVVGANLELTFLARRATGTGYENLVRRYEVQTGTTLANPTVWTGLSGYTSVSGADNVVTATVPLAGASARFYRLRAWLETAP